jgi:hypothetical protein
MNDLVKKWIELELIHKFICEKIQKVHRIMFAQDIHFLTRDIENYRVQYLKNLHIHRKAIVQQQSDLLDHIDIKEITSVLQE